MLTTLRAILKKIEIGPGIFPKSLKLFINLKEHHMYTKFYLNMCSHFKYMAVKNYKTPSISKTVHIQR